MRAQFAITSSSHVDDIGSPDEAGANVGQPSCTWRLGSEA